MMIPRLYLPRMQRGYCHSELSALHRVRNTSSFTGAVRGVGG